VYKQAWSIKNYRYVGDVSIIIMLLAETQLIVSLDRLLPRAIVKGRIRALQRTDLATSLNLVYVLYMCVSWKFIWMPCAGHVGRRAEPLGAGRRVELPSTGRKGEAPERGLKGRSPRA
jgi:hypothetical protein